MTEPDFVSAYEIGEYIYFFFRETAVEYINCGKVSCALKTFIIYYIRWQLFCTINVPINI